MKASVKTRRVAAPDGIAPLHARVAELEGHVATLDARTARLTRAVTAMRALYVEGARVLDI